MPLNLNFANGTPVDDATMNSMVSYINQLEARIASAQATIDAVSKTQLLVVANKLSQLDITGNGSATSINGWQILGGQPNVDSQFTVATGAFKAKLAGAHTFDVKTLVSASNAPSPRVKLTLLAPSGEIILDEDTTFQEQAAIVQNYRRSLKGQATVSLSPDQTVFIQIAVWGAATARIFGDVNTEVRISRSIS